MKLAPKDILLHFTGGESNQQRLPLTLFHHFTRIAPQSLGLFRLLFGLTLIRDLAYRWTQRIAFYSNQGVLTNHNHLFQLKGQGRFVWSAFHAVSTPGEATVVMAAVLVCYALFTIGYHTRIFHAVSLVCLVSLSARNLLAEGAGEAIAIALLGLTLFLPLGTAFSVDALRDKMRAARETKAPQLLDRSTLLDEADIQAGRRAGWSPVSIAAFGTLALIAVVLLTLGKLQTGSSWQDGTALHKALHVFMIANPNGFAWRDSALLGPLTQLLHHSQLAIPVLLVVPVVRGPARAAAAALLLAYGLTYGVLTTWTLFGLSIASAAALVIAPESWRRWATGHQAKRVRTVIFDVDCGICFWLAKLMRRFDTRRHLLFMGNGEFGSSALPKDEQTVPMLQAWDEKTKAVVDKPMPKGITAKLVENTVVAVRPDGTFATRGAAVAEVLRAVPGFGWLGLLLSIPGIAGVRDALYDMVAARRTAISVELGLTACGVASVTKAVPIKEPLSPARVLRNRVLAVARELGALVFLLAVMAQTARANAVGVSPERFPMAKQLESIAWWTRSTARWDVLVPEAPEVEGGLVVDAQTKDGRKLDLMTGQEPDASLDRPFALGAMWAAYLDKVHRDDYRPYQQGLQTYFSQRGPRYEPPEEPPNARLFGADGYWIERPAIGEAPPVVVRMFRQARGGAVLGPVLAQFMTTSPTSPRPRDLPLPRRDPATVEPEGTEPTEPTPLRYPETPESPGQEQQ